MFENQSLYDQLHTPAALVAADRRHDCRSMGVVELFEELISRVIGDDEKKDMESRSMLYGDSPGMRISPFAAAACIRCERTRTFKFWVALHNAICDVIEARGDTYAEGTPINVLYVGPGPYATLSLPAARWFGERVQFHLVEAWEQSIEYSGRLVDAFGIGGSYPTRLCKDAVDLDFERDLPVRPDIVVMEIMERALTKEPQAHVVQTLMSQFGDAILIPEKISVGVGFRPVASSDFIGDVQPFVTLTRDGLSVNGSLDRDTFRVQGEFVVPQGAETFSGEVALSTRIQVYKDIALEPDEKGSGITRTLPVGRLMPEYGNPLKLGYVLCQGASSFVLS